jgi:diguanylate cyclase (GGDEF)-like protein/PAS domain S-box-containing protein
MLRFLGFRPLVHRPLPARTSGVAEDAAGVAAASHPDRLIFALVAAALVGIWGVWAAYLAAERGRVIERAQTQLANIVSTLADLDELTEIAGAGSQNQDANARRAAAIWRALLQYPAASIWFEGSGAVSAGQPPEAELGSALVVEESRRNFTVHAALPQSEVLVEWRKSAWQQSGILLAVTLGFLLLTRFLAQALHQRAAAERDAAAARARENQEAVHRGQLEHTVAERTAELQQANTLLNVELGERKAAEAALREHDALLNAVTKGAGELLGSHSLDESIPAVLELIGQTVAVARVQLAALETDTEGHLRSSVRYEWCAPGSEPMIDNPALRGLDLSANFPPEVASALGDGLASFFVEEVAEPYRSVFAAAQMQSFLQVPVLIDRELWGSIGFIDASGDKRRWSWAETDTLKTLAGLIGAAVARARQVKELADANMIVQNSPTILYRLRGEPSLPLIYVSHNITKFGHDPKQLVGSTNWVQRIVHPDDQAKLGEAMASIQQKDAQGAAMEFRLLTGDGRTRWVENRYTPVRDANGGLVEVEGIIIDITERKAAEEKIALLARTDGLTGLANRATFVERLRQAFAAARRGAAPFAVLYLDLDHFKDVNDTLGHPIGDQLLQQIAERLKQAVRETDLVARLGGDEFAILQTELSEPAGAGALAAKILSTASQPCRCNGHDVHVTVSIGICPYVADSSGPDEMLAQADLALYRAKDDGRNSYRFHSEDLDQQVLDRVTVAEELKEALAHDQLTLHYQPQVDLDSGRIVGMEALVRWNHPTRGLLYPAVFVPIAEKTGLITALGQWVLDRACRQMGAWRDAGMAPSVIVVNLSLSEIKTGQELVSRVADAISRWQLSPPDLEFDVTEATLAQVTWAQNDVLERLRRLGVKIAIDDFGTEYSSFEYLRAYHVNHLKIAQEFIGAAAHEPERAATVRAIINLARELGIGVIAEGVETEEQRRLLLASGSTTQAQGFYFSAAVDADRAGDLLRQGSIRPPHALDPPTPAATCRGAAQ